MIAWSTISGLAGWTSSDMDFGSFPLCGDQVSENQNNTQMIPIKDCLICFDVSILSMEPKHTCYTIVMSTRAGGWTQGWQVVLGDGPAGLISNGGYKLI